MSQEDASRSAGLPIALLAGLMLFTGGYLFLDKPLEGMRSSSGATKESFELRLWQDPLEPVYDLLAVEVKRKRNSSGSSAQISVYLQNETRSPEQVSSYIFDSEAWNTTEEQPEYRMIAVAIPGEKYLLPMEMRRRVRYAVISALSERYIPEQTNKIGVLNLSAVDPHFSPKRSDDLRLVPYELFNLERNSVDGNFQPVRLLLAWVTQDVLGPKPLAAIDELAQSLESDDRKFANKVLLGPYDSGGLKRIWRELSAEEQLSGKPDSESDLLVLSPRATMPNDLLAAKFPSDSSPQQKATQQIYRTLATDDLLLDGILNELIDRRGLEPESSAAILYEMDSDYGRALERHITDCDVNDEDRKCFDQVDTYGYLRGLDGVTTGETAPDDGFSSSSQGTNGGELRQPSGNHQFDYLRRIANQIDNKDYQAIGVLGTDVFDKLLVLQALKPRNPDAVFFTTDLEAWYLHPSQYDWSRNMLVASPYPLNNESCSKKFGVDLGSRIPPPFRDSYQAAYYYSTCLAMLAGPVAHATDPRQSGPLSERVSNLVAGYDVYEVGRRGFVRLGKQADGKQTVKEPTVKEPTMSIEQLLVWLLLLAPLLGMIGWLTMHRSRRLLYPSESDEMPSVWYLNLSLVVGFYGLLIILGTLALAINATGTGGEPVSLTSGVSGWPMALIRMEVVTLCILFLLFIIDRLRRSNREIESLLGINKQQIESEELPEEFADVEGIGQWMHQVNAEAAHTDEPISVVRIWRQYSRLGSLQLILRRTALKSFLSLAVIFTMLYYFAPQPALTRFADPESGVLVSVWLNLLLGPWFQAEFILLALITFYAANAYSRLGRVWIRAMRIHRLDWSGDFCRTYKFTCIRH